jgi:hypothetical protein
VSRAYTLVGWAVSGSVDDGLWLVLSRFVSCHAELVTTGPVGPCCAVLSWSPIALVPGRAWAEPKSPYFEPAHLGFVWQGLNNSRPTLLPGLDLIVPGVSLKPCDKQIQSVIKTARKKFVRLFQLFKNNTR